MCWQHSFQNAFAKRENRVTLNKIDKINANYGTAPYLSKDILKELSNALLVSARMHNCTCSQLRIQRAKNTGNSKTKR